MAIKYRIHTIFIQENLTKCFIHNCLIGLKMYGTMDIESSWEKKTTATVTSNLDIVKKK